MIPIRAASLKENLLIFLLVLFYVSEAINKVTIFLLGDSIVVAKTIKGVVLMYCGICILASKLFRKKLLLISAIALIFLAGQLFIQPNLNALVVVNVIKYIFPLVLFIYFNQNEPNRSKVSYAVKIFEKIILLNSMLLIVGFLFDIYVFQTYEAKRFGYNGLLVSSSTASYFYSIALFHYFIKYKKRLFFKLQGAIILISIPLVGTKSLIVVLLFILGLYTSLYIKKRWRFPVFLILFLAFIYIGYYIIYRHEIFNRIMQEDGVLASLTSLRSKILIEEMIPFIENNWQWPNYLFGGINDLSTRPQLALFDLFYFFGLLGTLVYLYVYLKNYFSFKINVPSRLFFVILFLMCSISGNFFLNASIVIYLIILRESIKKYEIE